MVEETLRAISVRAMSARGQARPQAITCQCQLDTNRYSAGPPQTHAGNAAAAISIVLLTPVRTALVSIGYRSRAGMQGIEGIYANSWTRLPGRSGRHHACAVGCAYSSARRDHAPPHQSG